MIVVRSAGLALLAALAGCGDYEPVVRADHDSPRYAADVSACQTQGAADADRRVKARGPLFLTYPVSFPLMERRAITDCMAGKGYVAED